MKKKFATFALVVLILPVLFILSACGEQYASHPKAGDTYVYKSANLFYMNNHNYSEYDFDSEEQFIRKYCDWELSFKDNKVLIMKGFSSKEAVESNSRDEEFTLSWTKSLNMNFSSRIIKVSGSYEIDFEIDGDLLKAQIIYPQLCVLEAVFELKK